MNQLNFVPKYMQGFAAGFVAKIYTLIILLPVAYCMPLPELFGDSDR
jgi:hypothetical protein